MKFSLAPVQSQNRFDKLKRQAILAEQLGYEALWAHEHHSEGMMYPSPLMVLSILASKTKTIKLGTNMLLLSLPPSCKGGRRREQWLITCLTAD